MSILDISNDPIEYVSAYDYLPKKNDTYICVIEYDPVYLGDQRYASEQSIEFCVFWNGKFCNNNSSRVIYWAPLPKTIRRYLNEHS